MQCIKSLKEGKIKNFSTNLPCYYFGEDHVCYEETMKSILKTYKKLSMTLFPPYLSMALKFYA